jgi:hypothetical protein
LVAQTFTGAGREHRERAAILWVQKLFNDVALSGAKGIETEMVLKKLVDIHKKSTVEFDRTLSGFTETARVHTAGSKL